MGWVGDCRSSRFGDVVLTKESKMSNELAVQQETQRMPQQFTNEDIELIRDTVCKGATDTEFKLFINQAKTTGLNPLARQVFAVKRWDSSLKREAMSIQVSIDGFRLIAERTGKYAGQTPPQWCGEDGVWKDVWLASEPPAAARVGVLRSDFKEPCYRVARFDSYAQTKKEGGLTHMWAKMGDVMIAKCAESLALRTAFPQELSGLYTSDEMAQATPEEREPAHTLADPQVRGTAAEDAEKLRLVEEGKKYYEEIPLCDNEEKLDLVVKRYAMTMAKLSVYFPKRHAQLVQVLREKRDSLVQQTTEAAE
jgi:phage recombination protein Bet